MIPPFALPNSSLAQPVELASGRFAGSHANGLN
jgi:hypothetical protein